MAIVTFQPTAATMSASAGRHERDSPVLSYNVQLPRGEYMQLETGEDFDDLDGRVTVLPDAEEIAALGEGTGALHYFAAHDDEFHPFPPSYIVEVRVPKQQFEALLSTSKHGRIPSEISVDVEGLEYDWRPDGRGKKWQNKSSSRLLVNSVRFTVPLVSVPNAEAHEPSPAENVMPLARSHATLLTEKLEALHLLLKQDLRAILVLLIVAVLLIILRWIRN